MYQNRLTFLAESKGFCPALPRYRLAPLVAPSAKRLPRSLFFRFAPSLFESLTFDFNEKMIPMPKGTGIIFWRRARDSNPRSRFSDLHDFQSCSFDQLGQLSIYSSKHFQSALILYIIDYKKSRVNLYFLSNFKEVESTRNILHSNFCRNIISSMI